MDLKTYCINKGNKDYRPVDPVQIGWINPGKYLIYEFEMSKEGGFDYKDPVTGQVDQDWHDWKKGGGLSLAGFGLDMINLIKLDRDNVMWAWRWNPVKENYQFTGYSNSKGKKRVGGNNEVMMELDYDQRGWCAIQHRGKTSTVWLGENSFPGSPAEGEVVSFDHRKKFTCYRQIGLYYGGDNNSTGIWGGRSPVDHCHRVGSEFVIS